MVLYIYIYIYFNKSRWRPSNLNTSFPSLKISKTSIERKNSGEPTNLCVNQKQLEDKDIIMVELNSDGFHKERYMSP